MRGVIGWGRGRVVVPMHPWRGDNGCLSRVGGGVVMVEPWAFVGIACGNFLSRKRGIPFRQPRGRGGLFSVVRLNTLIAKCTHLVHFKAAGKTMIHWQNAVRNTATTRKGLASGKSQ